MPAKKKIETTKPSRSDAPTCSVSSDTPETDVATHLMQHAPNQWLAVVDAEFAEKLERERNAVLRKLATCRESLDDYSETVKNLEDVRDKLRTEIDRLKRELIIAYTPESRDDHDL